MAAFVSVSVAEGNFVRPAVIAALAPLLPLPVTAGRPAQADAASIVQTISGLPETNDDNYNNPTGYIYVQPFDPSLGTLEDVTLTLEGLAVGGISATFFPPSPNSTPAITLSLGVEYVDPESSSLYTQQAILGTNPLQQPIPSTGFTGAIYSTLFMVNQTFDLSNDLEGFIENSAYPDYEPLITYAAGSTVDNVTVFELFNDLTTTEIARATLTYTYAIPEPASLALFCVGVAGVAATRRRAATRSPKVC